MCRTHGVHPLVFSARVLQQPVLVIAGIGYAGHQFDAVYAVIARYGHAYACMLAYARLTGCLTYSRKQGSRASTNWPQVPPCPEPAELCHWHTHRMCGVVDPSALTSTHHHDASEPPLGYIEYGASVFTVQ